MADLKHKIDDWLTRKAESRTIAEAGMGRPLAEGTSRLRLDLLLDALAGLKKGFSLPIVAKLTYLC